MKMNSKVIASSFAKVGTQTIGKSLKGLKCEHAQSIIRMEPMIKQPNQLSNKLNMLCDSPDYRQWMSKEIACRSKNFLWSWNERINTETELLESIVRGNSV